jgi:hypothetical protein
MQAKLHVRPQGVAANAHISVNLTSNQQRYAEIYTEFRPGKSRNMQSAGRNPFAPVNAA